MVEGGGSLPMQAPLQQLRLRPPAAGPRDEVRLAQQRHALRGRAVRRTPGPAGAARPRHTRPLLRSPVRGRLNQQLRLHRAAATGTAEAEYLLTDRDDDGPVPDGMRVVAAPTGVFTIVGRVQLNGEADLPAVHALQDQFTITPPGGPGRRSPGRGRRRSPARSTRPRGAALVGTVPGGSGGVPPPPPTSSS